MTAGTLGRVKQGFLNPDVSSDPNQLSREAGGISLKRYLRALGVGGPVNH